MESSVRITGAKDLDLGQIVAGNDLVADVALFDFGSRAPLLAQVQRS